MEGGWLFFQSETFPFPLLPETIGETVVKEGMWRMWREIIGGVFGVFFTSLHTCPPAPGATVQLSVWKSLILADTDHPVSNSTSERIFIAIKMY